MILLGIEVNFSQQIVENGAGERNRTTDLRITNALLYQLSYTGNHFTRRCTTDEGAHFIGKNQKNARGDASNLFRNGECLGVFTKIESWVFP